LVGNYTSSLDFSSNNKANIGQRFFWGYVGGSDHYIAKNRTEQLLHNPGKGEIVGYDGSYSEHNEIVHEVESTTLHFTDVPVYVYENLDAPYVYYASVT